MSWLKPVLWHLEVIKGYWGKTEHTWKHWNYLSSSLDWRFKKGCFCGHNQGDKIYWTTYEDQINIFLCEKAGLSYQQCLVLGRIPSVPWITYLLIIQSSPDDRVNSESESSDRVSGQRFFNNTKMSFFDFAIYLWTVWIIILLFLLKAKVQWFNKLLLSSRRQKILVGTIDWWIRID